MKRLPSQVRDFLYITGTGHITVHMKEQDCQLMLCQLKLLFQDQDTMDATAASISTCKTDFFASERHYTIPMITATLNASQ